MLFTKHTHLYLLNGILYRVLYIYPTNYKINFFALGVKVVQGTTSSRGGGGG